MLTLQDWHNAKKVYVESLAKELQIDKALLWKIVHLLWPKIEQVSGTEDHATFRVTMSPAMNVLGAVACGDFNAKFHTGEGYLQTLCLVGMCSAVTSAFRPGYALAKIEEPVEFRAAVPIGQSVFMEARQVRGKSGGRLSVFEIEGVIEACQTPLFNKPRILTMRRISP